MNIYAKISQVMKDIEYLSKDDKVEFGNTKYKAITEEKVTRAVRESLIKNGIVIIPIEQEHSREGTLSTVNTKYKIQNIDDVNDFIISVSSGTGADTQDKGVGKAMTYSYKYLLLRTFAIPTGEDPDKISSAELDSKQKAAQEKHPKNETAPHPTEIEMQMILSFATTLGIDVSQMMAGYEINTLNELTREQTDKLIAGLEKRLHTRK